MITQQLIGGLWNQLFQYAYIKALSLRTKQKFLLDISSFQYYKLHNFSLDCFNIEKNYTMSSHIPRYNKLHSSNNKLNFLLSKFKEVCRTFNPHHYREKQFNFDNNFFTIQSWYIEGYFQTEKYFIDYRDEILLDLKINKSPSIRNQELLDVISSSNSISIHIRRWDYLNTNNQNLYSVCNKDYYYEAMNYIKSKEKDIKFFIFSDDPMRVKENLKIDDAHYIDRNDSEKNYEDLRLMSQCKHNIIANSSFSRWWARLNINPNKIVISPKKRFANNTRNYSDVVPKSRIKI